MNACWRCGAPVNATDKFCGVCAAPLSGPGAAPVPGVPAPPPAPPAPMPGAYAPAGYGSGPTAEPPPAAPFGQPPAAPFGQPSPYGQQPPAPFGQPPPSPYGQQPPAPFGQQPPAPFGQQPPAPFGQQPPAAQGYGYPPPPPAPGFQSPYGPPPAMPEPASASPMGEMKIAGSEAFEATAFAPENQGLPPTGPMSPFNAQASAPEPPMGQMPYGQGPGGYAPPSPMQPPPMMQNPMGYGPGPGALQGGFPPPAQQAPLQPQAQQPAMPRPLQPQPPMASPQAHYGAPVDAIGDTGVASGQSRELRGFLYSFQNDPKGVFWPLYSGNNVVGRAGAGEQLDIEIADPTTSSRHATLSSDGVGRLVLRDEGSTNGTFVNEMPIGHQGQTELHDGDRIRLGGYNVSVRFVSR